MSLFKEDWLHIMTADMIAIKTTKLVALVEKHSKSDQIKVDQIQSSFFAGWERKIGRSEKKLTGQRRELTNLTNIWRQSPRVNHWPVKPQISMYGKIRIDY